jgi:hypothetical protein
VDGFAAFAIGKLHSGNSSAPPYSLIGAPIPSTAPGQAPRRGRDDMATFGSEATPMPAIISPIKLREVISAQKLHPLCSWTLLIIIKKIIKKIRLRN